MAATTSTKDAQLLLLGSVAVSSISPYVDISVQTTPFVPQYPLHQESVAPAKWTELAKPRAQRIVNQQKIVVGESKRFITQL